jgi:hypothetical protein
MNISWILSYPIILRLEELYTNIILFDTRVINRRCQYFNNGKEWIDFMDEVLADLSFLNE